MSNDHDSNQRSESQPAFVSALLRADAYPHRVDEIRLIETHISWVFLTGCYAYKIKKNVNFGFLDFSTLDKRRKCCEQELRLNRRLAAALYLDVVPVCGPPSKAVVGGTGEVIEYAVKMRQFDVQNGFDMLLARSALTAAHIDATAQVLARFHSDIAIADQISPFGTPDAIRQPVMGNLDHLIASLQPVEGVSQLVKLVDRVRQWTVENHSGLTNIFCTRKREGFIRECHGDLHLRNIVIRDGQVTPFDCIEFNDNLRWIDVISELAFLLMDLDDHHQSALGRRLLNHYLSLTGDYGGLQVLRYYQVYRAVVRAKVAALRLGQSDHERAQLIGEIGNYVQLADRYTRVHSPRLVMTHGLSGAREGFLARRLLLATDLIHLRFDIERKRCFGPEGHNKTGSATNAGIDTPEATKQTCRRLLDLSRTILSAGFSVLVDGTFLQREHRNLFKALADELNLPFTILHCEADRELLQQRQLEKQDASQANEAVLQERWQTYRSLEDDERGYVLIIPAEGDIKIGEIVSALNGTDRD